VSPSLNSGVPALLLRLDRNPFHHGSLGAVRSLGRAGIEVHAFTETPRVPLARSGYLHRAHPFPRPGEVAAALERAAELIGRPAVLLPMDDLSALTAARLARRLRGRYLLPEVDPALPERLADKAQLAVLCAELGLAHPPTVVPASAAEAEAAASELGLPLVAKWSRPWLLPRGGAQGAGRGLRSTTVLTGADQVRRLFARSAEAGSRLLLQRMLPGGPGADWFFHGCFGAGGRLLAGGTGRKELAWPVRAGLTAVGSWLPHAQLTRDVVGLAGRLGYQGIVDLDFRWDAATGAYHLLDANPRPGAQFRLFTDGQGIDVVRAQHLALTGRPVPEPRPVPGRLFVAENYGLLSRLLSRRADRAGLLPRPPGGGRREVETAWFAADDLAPFLSMGGSCVRRAADRILPVRRVTRTARAVRRVPGSAATAAGARTTAMTPSTPTTTATTKVSGEP
jgi:predicted ATP-grasp superfamily ATP-dependent carboligase